MLINSPNISGSLTITGNSVITGSLTVLGGITGAITGSATTASYVEYTNVANKPTLVSGSSQVTYSGLTGIPSGIVSGSSQVTYSGLTGIPSGIVSGSAQITGFGIFATTGSNQFNGNQAITGSLTTTGTIVAQTLNVQQVTSSIVYSSGSNIFGNDLSNTQQFTGSLSVNGQGTFYQPLTNSTSYLTIQNNRARNAAVYTQTTNGGFYAGTSIGTDTFNYQIYDGVAGSARLTISSTGAATFSSTVAATQYTATSTGGSGLRIYGAAGTNQWDIYLNGANIRFSDNTGTGSFVVDRPATFSSSVTATQFVANGSGTNDLLYLDAGINTDFAAKIVSGANDILVFRRQHVSSGALDIMALGFNGNVGIGTDSISNGTAFGGGGQINRLKVQSTNYTCLEINGSTSGGSIQFTYGTNLPNQVAGLIGYNYGSGTVNEFYIGNSLSGPLIFGTNNTERIRIGSTANQFDLMVGTTSALQPATNRGSVSINGSSSSILSLGVGNSTKAYFYTGGTTLTIESVGASADINFAAGNVDRMKITSTGAIVHEGLNVRKTKSGGTSVSFIINLAATGYWAPGYATVRVAGSRGGLQEHYSAMYFLRITYYQGSTSAAVYNIGGDTGNASVSVTSALVSSQSQITITVSDAGTTTDYLIADIDASFQTGIASIT